MHEPTTCSKCGRTNPAEARFCTDCGSSLSSEPDASSPQQLLATRGSRLVAKLIDWAVFVAPIILFFIPSIVAGDAVDAPGFVRIALASLGLISILAIAVVQIVLLSKDGQTIGKKALHIRIVKVSTGQNGGFVPNVLLRGWLNFLIGVIPFYRLVDVLFILRKDRRCIHDLIAATRVIQ